MDRTLHKVTKIKINGQLKQLKIYKARRLFRYYKRFKIIYLDNEDGE